MFISSENDEKDQNEVHLDTLSEELRLLEVETFEIEDFIDLGQEMPVQWHSCFCVNCSK